MELMNGSTVNFTEASVNLTTSEHDMLTIFALSFHFVFGFLTHSYVIWILITGTASGLASEFFNLNLSVFENILSLNSLFNLLTIRFPNLIIISHFLMGVVISGRPLFQCLICVERYLAVVHPVTFLKYRPLRYRVICCAVVWIISVGFCLFSMFILVLLTDLSSTWLCTVLFLFFLSIQLFCLVAVLRALKQSGPGERGRERKEENHMKRRAFYLILITTVSLILIYLPTAITGFHWVLTQGDNQELWSSSKIIFFLAGFVEPILFLHRTGKLSCLCSYNFKNTLILQ
ncbi:hydroxycarboxylic acid receptor 2-like [Labeo rohita]|uniref:hydroxycarboxylic acid receptor 2-like n=1 Tax=Labeo rohita TaxID=84645 RepID=UPI0021E25798|nr:hydroxycarboxylic acid receptor 2-like [Labeo rohita]